MEKLRSTKTKIAMAFALSGLSVVLLSGCQDGKPKFDSTKAAKVIGHKHVPESDGTIPVGSVQVPTHQDEEFKLTLRQCPADEPDEPCVDETVEVSEAVYESHPVGSIYTVDPQGK